MTHVVTTTSTNGATHSLPPRPRTNGPSVLLYGQTDYREYLQAFFEAKKAHSPQFSQSAFIRKAGMGKNSRGYLKLVIEGKRNLTPHTIRGFSTALGLSPHESLYFENLVYFTQAKTPRDREYYFQRLMASCDGKSSKQFELMLSQYHYYTHWYYPAIRELVGLATFQENLGWISAQLRSKVPKKEITQALHHLETLGLIERDPNGRLVQSEPLVKFAGGVFNATAERFHVEMMDRAKEALQDDEYKERNCSSVTLSCDYDRLPEIIKAIATFRDEINLKFGLGSKNPDTVFQINVQVFQITPIKEKNNVPIQK